MSTRKIDTILNGLEKNSSLSRDGRNWLIAAIDPFHDSDLSLSGYPDVLTSNSVVQLVKQQFQITVPGTTGTGAVAAGANWDCSIALFPSLVNGYLNNATVVNNFGVVQSTNTTTGTYVGGCVAMGGPANATLWPTTGNYAPNSVSVGSAEPYQYCKGQGRIISMGFEVVNTTAELYKQGQVTAWRMPGQWSEQDFYYQTSAGPPALYTQYTGLTQRLPPGYLSAAQLLYGSRSWGADEGAYVVARQNSEDNPGKFPSFRFLAYTADDNASGVSGNTFMTGPAAAFNGTPTQNADYYAPFDLSGVHFTGLSYTTSLTVTCRWFIERIPGPSEPDLVVLASPSCPYDSLALELYCNCLRDMPPGVMLKENPLGEWFREALQGVAEWAPKIGSALGGIIPGAAVVGSGLGHVAGVASSFIPQKAKKQIKKQIQRAEQAAVSQFIGPKSQKASQNDRRFIAAQAARGARSNIQIAGHRKKKGKGKWMPITYHTVGQASTYGDPMQYSG